MRISDWSSDVCSSDLFSATLAGQRDNGHFAIVRRFYRPDYVGRVPAGGNGKQDITRPTQRVDLALEDGIETIIVADSGKDRGVGVKGRSEEHTSELQSLMRISYAVFCLKTKKQTQMRISSPAYYTQ